MLAVDRRWLGRGKGAAMYYWVALEKGAARRPVGLVWLCCTRSIWAEEAVAL